MRRTVQLRDVVAGMCLANELCDDLGRVLLPAGCLLTPAILKALQRREIGDTTAITIDDSSAALPASEFAPAPEAPSAQDAIKARIDHIFRHSADNPTSTLTVLRDAVSAHKLAKKP